MKIFDFWYGSVFFQQENKPKYTSFAAREWLLYVANSTLPIGKL